MPTSQSAPLRTMVARISADDIVIYANAALASYLSVKKRDLIGSPLEVVSRRCKGEISSCFSRPDTGRSSNHLVTDDSGRVFEAKVYSDGGVLDIVLDEVTNAESIGRELRDASGTAFESLSEDELRTTRHPERRYLTVTYTQLRGVSQLTERLAPMEVRLMVNSFVEEASDAVFEGGCTVGETSGDSILGIFGAPRYYTDHPLRAIRAACDQMRKAAQLHAGFHREGKELPPNSCGIWTGDVLVGTLGNSAWQHYTALGLPVELAQKLADLARPGEILLPEHTLTHLLRVLPPEWEHVRAESEYEPDLSDFQWSGDDIAPVAEHLKKVVYLVGPGVQDNAEQVELFFSYLWALKIPGREQYVPILQVTRPMGVGDSLELSEDNVVTTQVAQTLGKYKLIQVIGTGGMGKVWRGVDRFGNVVAIKVLHSSETVTESQLKRFRREAEIMARLPHRNICRVFEMNEFDGIQYLAMEFVDGLTLSDLLYEKVSSETAHPPGKVDLKSLIHSIRSGKSIRENRGEEESVDEESSSRPKTSRILPVEQTLSVLLKVCDAVQFAHEHGVLHRDLKPGNILLREDGEPLVADFGLAKLNTADATQSLSMTGHVVGTLENMSPEQAESSKTVDERADVYALGTILYQMLTGRRHFEATGNIVVDAQALKTHSPVRPRALNAQIDLDLEIITLKALRNDPVERYRSVAALQADIERYRRGEVISARPVSPAELFKKLVQRNRAVTTAIAGAIGILVLGALGTIYLQSTRLKEKDEYANDLKNANLAILTEKNKAEKATAVASDNESKAKANEAKFKELAEEANKQAEDYKTALEQLKTAQQEVGQAKEYGAKADAATKELQQQADRLKSEKEEAEKKLALQRELDEAKRTAMANGSRRGLGPRFQEPGSPEGGNGPESEAQEAFLDAKAKFFVGGVQNANTLEDAVAKLSSAMDLVSKALVIDPNFVPALILKGRLHLCLLEYDQAVESLTRATQLLGNGAPPMPGEDPAALLQILNQSSTAFSDKSVKILEALSNSAPESPNEITSKILKSVSAKAKKSTALLSSSNPLNRPVLSNELTLALVEKNGVDTKVYVKVGTDGKPVVIVWNNEKLADLTPLKQLDPSGVGIIGAKSIDWTTLRSLPHLVSLDLSKSVLDGFPTGFPRPFLQLQSLNLSEADVSNIEFLRGMALQTLDLSGTNVTDLSPLVACTRLLELNIAGLNPSNLQTLLRVPVQSLVVSPLLVTDKPGLNSLRADRSLKILRTPDDKPDQHALEFWDKIDRGFYNQTN